MSRLKQNWIGVFGVLVALISCGIVAPAASAEFALTTKLCSGGKNVNFCYENAAKELLELSGTEELEFLKEAGGQSIVLTSNAGSAEVRIVCEFADPEHEVEGKLVENGLILQPEPLVKDYTFEFQLLFLGCKLSGTLAEKCEIPIEDTTTPLRGVTEESNDEFILTKPVTPTKVITIKVKNKGEVKCPATVVGERSVTGEVLCFILEALAAKAEHLLVCDPEKGGQTGKLFYGASENAATFLIEANLFLLGIKEADPWSISNEA